MNIIAKLIATGFGLGYFPIMPASVSCLITAIIYYIIMQALKPSGLWFYIPYTIIIIIIFFIGVWASTKFENIVGRKDPKSAVIDEIISFPVAMFLLPSSIEWVIAGFVLLRILDAVKPPPAYQWQELTGGWGIMMDDLIAGIYTNLILQVAHYANVEGLIRSII